MATIGEMIVKLVADTTGFKGQMEEAAATVKGSQDAMAASMASSMQAFKQFDAIQKGSITTAEDLASAQSALNAARASGAFTDDEIAAKEALVAAAMKKVGSETQEASGVLSMFTRNSRTMYSTSALITDAMTGQFSRMRREVAALGNETGLMAKAFQFAVSPAGLVAAALAAVGVAAFQAEEDIAHLRQAIGAGGGMAGMDAQQLENLAQSFKKMGFDVHDARTAIEALAQSGTVTRGAMRDAALAAQETAQVTGQQADKVAQELARAMAMGERGVLKLDEKYKFLNDSQLKTIQQLFSSGQAAEAQKQAFSDLANSMGAVIQEHGGTMDSFWQRFGTTVANTWDTIAHGVNKDTQQQIDKLNEQIKYYEHIGVSQEKINELIKQRNALEAQAAADAKTAAQRGNVAESRYNRDAAAAHHTNHSSGMSQLTQELRQEEEAQHVSYDKRLQFEADFYSKAASDQKNSLAVRADAYREYQNLRHQLDAQGLAQQREAAAQGRAASQEAKRQHEQDAQSAIRALEVKRDATERFSKERMQLDAEIVAAAIKWYGKDSSAYRQAERQKIADAREAAAEQRAIAISNLQDSYEGKTSGIEQRREDAREAFREGQTNARQLLAAVTSADDAKAAADQAYYAGLMKLDTGNAVKIAADHKALTAQLDRDDKQHKADVAQTLREITVEYERTYQRIGQVAMQNINGMIFQHERLRQALANIGMQILETEESKIVKSIAASIAGEEAKTAAKAASTQSQVGITVAGEAEMLAVHGASAIKWIVTEAAKAAAGAFNAMVSIPYIGPFVAVGASIAAGAAVMALVGKVASAEGGWERVPADGMTTVLHRDEMVLPKRIADPMRDMATGRGSHGGNVHYHIKAVDARSLLSLAKRNPAVIHQAMGAARRNGWTV